MQPQQQEEQTYVSGNIFGWRISFISLGIILATLFIAILLGVFDKNQTIETKNGMIDTTKVQQMDTLGKVK